MEHKSCCSPERHSKAIEKENNQPISHNPDATDMVRLQGGRFLMGTDYPAGFPEDGEGPIREITLSPFLIDKAAVTNRQFSEFVKETGYKTEAEVFGWTFVFHLFVPASMVKQAQRPVNTPWWLAINGANWRRPEGPLSGISQRMDHPVVHVSWNDASAYAKWAGKRLPTEAEWEFAARGGREQNIFPWGDELEPDGNHVCNVWQGNFPIENTALDGYIGTAPAVSFAPNDFGLYNVCGNVWEWCSDWFDTTFHVHGPRNNPTGPPNGNNRVIRGGSFLCHHSYCNRYRVAARSSNTPNSSTGNMGFRCALDA